jgi:hypothetical protein
MMVVEDIILSPEAILRAVMDKKELKNLVEENFDAAIFE